MDHIGLLSSEAVCTENLTPFLLLLPTRGKGGLGLLANPLKPRACVAGLTTMQNERFIGFSIMWCYWWSEPFPPRFCFVLCFFIFLFL